MHGPPILTADRMRAAERAMFDAGMPEYDLMERAGAACAEYIWRAGGGRETLVLCGPGNNGGDGFVIARLLKARGVSVRVAVPGESRTESSLRARAAWDGPVEAITRVQPATLLVDALFGTGLTRGLDEGLSDPLCRLGHEASRTFAIDLPSGVQSDSGELLSPIPPMALCIALGAYKPAHFLYPAAGSVDRTVLADIGITAPDAPVRALTPPTFRAPGPDVHKYSRGLVAVVAGTMSGAGVLAAASAAHAGAGAVRYLAPEPTSRIPDAAVMVHAPATADVARALEDRRVSAILVGPGLGRDDGSRDRLKVALNAGHPLVLDADAITLLADMDMEALPAGAILTPHEGEFGRLFGDLQGSKIDRARAAAQRSRGVVVYKGADTVIAAPDGRAAVTQSASPWLSTAGTGDVLAGICAARLAVVGDPFQAACEAVWLHGEAARRAGAAFVADALIPHIPAAIASRL